MPIGSFRLNTLAAAMMSQTYVSATGGLISTANISGTIYKIHTFTTVGNTNFVVTAGGNVEMLIVGGGGGGGGPQANYASGGGGAGKYQSLTGISTTAQTYVIAVGAGGTAGSGASGGTGGTSTGLGYTSAGGAGGPTNGGPGNNSTDASGSGATSNYPVTVQSGGTGGQSNGGSARGNGSSTYSGGGGGGSAGAGGNASATAGGAAGAGTQSSFNGTATYYAAGGGGGSSGTAGSAGSTGGVAGRTTSTGINATTYGSGGGGANGASGGNGTGGTGRQGIVMIRYPIATNYPTSISYVTSAQTITTSLTFPTVSPGDVAIVFMSAFNTTSTIPTASVPSGFTEISNTSVGTSVGGRMTTYYKICSGSEDASTITCMSGTNTTQSQILIYRPNVTPNGVTISTVNSQGTDSAPTTQSLVMTGITGPFIGIATYASQGSVSASSGTTATRTTGPSGGHFIKTFESLNSTVSFATSTISMTDVGANLMASYTITLT